MANVLKRELKEFGRFLGKSPAKEATPLLASNFISVGALSLAIVGSIPTGIAGGVAVTTSVAGLAGFFRGHSRKERKRVPKVTKKTFCKELKQTLGL